MVQRCQTRHIHPLGPLLCPCLVGSRWLCRMVLPRTDDRRYRQGGGDERLQSQVGLYAGRPVERKAEQQPWRKATPQAHRPLYTLRSIVARRTLEPRPVGRPLCAVGCQIRGVGDQAPRWLLPMAQPLPTQLEQRGDRSPQRYCRHAHQVRPQGRTQDGFLLFPHRVDQQPAYLDARPRQRHRRICRPLHDAPVQRTCQKVQTQPYLH